MYSDTIVYLTVFGVVAAMLVGKKMMFFDDKNSDDKR